MARGLRLLALIGLPLLLACGGGGGGGGGGTPTQPQTPQITFTPSSAGPGIVLAQGSGSNASTLILEVRAVQVSGLYGVAFDLDFPSAALGFNGYGPGTFLGAGGVGVSTQVTQTAPGHLVVGVSRLGANVGGVDGSGIVLTLQFSSVASGNGSFAFTRNSAYRADGSLLGLGWGGGTVSVVR